MKPKISITRWIPEEAVDLLRGVGTVSISPLERPLTLSELLDAGRGANALVTMLHDRVDKRLFDAAGDQLRVVANVAVGCDNIDLAAARRHQVVVTNTPGVLTDSTADLAMTLILMATRRTGEGERMIRAREVWSWHMGFLVGSSLKGKTLGIVGLGAIGRATAARARAFGMRICYSGRGRAPETVEAELNAQFLELDDLFSQCDVVSLHCPLTRATHHLVDRRRLELMHRRSYLVNTARGAIVDEAALVRVLRAGRIAGAALDVFEREPTVDDGLIGLENVVVTPHLGSATYETRTEMAMLAARNVALVLTDREPLTPVK